MSILTTPAPPRRNRPLAEVEAEQQKRPLNLKLGLGKVKLSSSLMPVLAIGLLVLLLLGVSILQSLVPVRGLRVAIRANHDNAFLNEEDLHGLAGEAFGAELIGAPMGELGLSNIEASLEAGDFVEHAEVYKRIDGQLLIDVSLRKPLARLIDMEGQQMYIDENGRKFSLSKRHAAHVPLVSGDFLENTEAADSLSCIVQDALPLLRFIRNDAFWNAQVSEVQLHANGEATLYPNVGDMAMHLGYPGERMAEKFEHLKLFLQQATREVGWNKYKRLSVAYRGQVVATRR